MTLESESSKAAEPIELPPGVLRRLATALGIAGGGGVVQHLATYLPTQAISAFAGFLVLPILARKLSPSDLGILAIAQTLVTFGWIVSGTWLVQAILRELPAHRQRRRMTEFSATLRRAVGFAALLFLGFAALLGLASTTSVAVRDHVWLILAAAAGLVVQNIAVSIYAAALRPRAYALVDVLARTGGIALGVYLVFSGHGVNGYLAGLAVCSGTVGTFGLLSAWPRAQRRADARAEVRPWLAYGLPLTASAVLIWGLSFIDRFLLAAFKSTFDVGIYSLGSVIGDKAVTIPAFAFFFASRPLLLRAYEQHGRDELERLLRTHTKLLLLISLPTVALVAVAAPIVVPLLTGGRYVSFKPAVAVAPIVAFGSLLYSVALLAGVGLLVAKRTRLLIGTALVGLAVNVAANLVLIPLYGLKGAAVATPIGAGAYLLASQQAAKRYATWNVPLGTLGRAAVGSLAGYAAARGLVGVVSASRTAELLLVLASGGVVYATSLIVLRERGDLA